MSEADRLALVTQLHGHRDEMRRLASGLVAVRALAAPDSHRIEVTSAQILQLRIKIALIESQLAAA